MSTAKIRWQRYLRHQAQVIRLYVSKRLRENPDANPFALEAEWVQFYAGEFRSRFGSYGGVP
jgi:hypothetical protein